MLVKNTGKKIIGMGAVYVAPNEKIELPEGYGPEHPTIKFYLAKKWLTPVKEKAAQVTEDDADDEETTDETTGDENAEPATNQAPPQTPVQVTIPPAPQASPIDSKIKAISKMNLEQLRGEAFNLGVEWAESDTKEMIRQKITEKLQTEVG